MDFTELLAAIVKHVTAKTTFYGAYRYRVIEQIGALVSLQAVGAVDGLPGMILVPKTHGLAGTTEMLAPSTLVLVMFEGGNPGAPFISHYLHDQAIPVDITFAIRDTIHLGKDGTPVALAGATDTNFATVLAALNVLNGLATPPKPALPGLPSVAAAKVLAE